MRHTSITFDEILLAAAGARGYETGNFDLVHLYHPRLLPYLYGLPVFLSKPSYPDEAGQWEDRAGFAYARALFFESSIPGQVLIYRARLVAVALAMLFILLVSAFVHRYYGMQAALLAAGLTAFLPDVLAHGGVSYNDVPVAAAFFAAVWGLDRAARSMNLASVSCAAALVAVALGVKYSALALVPIALALIGLEALHRGRQWRTYLIRALSFFLYAGFVIYLAIVVLHLGDFSLATFRAGLEFNVGHVIGEPGVPTWLLGQQHVGGIWYFYPLAFLIKTPVALHLLIIVALVGLALHRPSVVRLLRSPLRGPLVALGVISIPLLTSNLQVGFRHALPLLPFLLVVLAVGLDRTIRRFGSPARTIILFLMAGYVVSTASWYPHFLPYVSEYTPNRDRGHRLIADSSHDWGQGLIELRRFMEEEGIPRVYLSYFGSALPEAYGVEYVPLPSFFPLAPLDLPPEAPTHVVISATNLGGAYIQDSLARYRDLKPVAVVAHTLLVYEIEPGDVAR